MMDSNAFIRIIRWFDCVFYSIIITGILLFYPSTHRVNPGNPDIIGAIPLLFISLVTYKLPITVKEIDNWLKTVLRLRIFSVAIATLFPFLIWCFTFPDNIYFLINAQFAIFSGIGFLFFMNSFIQQLGFYSKSKIVIYGTKMTKFLLFYILLIPFLTLIITYIIDSYVSDSKNYNDFFAVIVLLPFWFKIILVIPIILSFIQFMIMRSMISNLFNFQPCEKIHS